MQKDRLIHLPFPKNGLFRGLAHAEEPLSTTPDCLNVRPHDPVEGRLRGGTRPGIVAAFKQRFASAPIRLISHVDVDSERQTFIDTFEDLQLRNWWKKPTFADYPLYVGPPYEEAHTNGFVILDMTEQGANINLDITQDYEIGLSVVPHNGVYGVAFFVFVCCEDGIAADPTDAGVLIAVRLGVYVGDGYIQSNDGTSTVERAFNPIAYGLYGRNEITIRVKGGNDTIDVMLNGHILCTDFPIPTAIQGNSQFGIGASSFTDGQAALIDAFRLSYSAETETYTNRRIAVVSAAQKLFRESFKGSFDVVVSDYLLRDDIVLESTPYTGKLYIADWSGPMLPSDTKCDVYPPGASTDGYVELDPASTVTFADIMDNTTCKQYLIQLTKEPGTGAHEGTYKINSIDGTNPRIAYVEGRPGSDTSLRTYCQVYRAPKVYDASSDSLDLWQEEVKASYNHKGIIPLGCSLICSYRDRIVLAGNQEEPHMWYMSRQGDPNDWDFTAPVEDVQRAVYGETISSGTRRERITALIPHVDDYLIFGYENELWVMRGDPADDGVLYNISREVGVVGSRAWCRTPEGDVVFLSRGGVYVVPSGGEKLGAIRIQPLSRDIIPQELMDLISTEYDINLAYDVRDNGILITVAPRSQRVVPLQWWLDWTTKSFWPWTPGDGGQSSWAMLPCILYEYRDPAHRLAPVLMGCQDGVVRSFDKVARHDGGIDGTPIEYQSYLEFAPLHVGFEGIQDALVIQMDAVLGAIEGDTETKQQGRVKWRLFGAPSAQDRQAMTTPIAEGTWHPYLNYRSFPRVRGVASLRIDNIDRWWAFEGVTLRLRPSGMVRMQRRQG